MMHKAWHNVQEVPYNFLRSSIKFQGHMGWKKPDDFNPIWVRLLGRSQLSNPSDLPCYITWYPLTTGIVTSQYLSSRDAVLMRRCLTPLGVFKYRKTTLPQIKHIYNESENLNVSCDIAFDSKNDGIFHKQCQWLAWIVWWHALAFVTRKITWRRAYVA